MLKKSGAASRSFFGSLAEADFIFTSVIFLKNSFWAIFSPLLKYITQSLENYVKYREEQKLYPKKARGNFIFFIYIGAYEKPYL